MKKKIYCLQWTDGEKTTNHGVFSSLDHAINSIHLWWELNDYTPSYARGWFKDGVTTIDYGLHHCFYKIKEVTKENFEEVMFCRVKATIQEVHDKEDTINDVAERLLELMNQDNKYPWGTKELYKNKL